jgi:apolipoprotein N-acyltransferase
LYGGLSLRLRGLEEVREILARNPNSKSQRDIRAAHVAKKFNSAIAIDKAGDVLGIYHKRILMPFGEYIPFADRYPELKKLSPQTADFSVGDKLDPISIPLDSNTDAPEQELKVAPLICYEDLISGPTLEGARRGADILVNLTNDAWYGETAAPLQHHLIAQWRAIEARKTLIRSTNTGLTAIVDPLGQTVSQLPVFTADHLVYDAPILSISTVYSQLGDLPSWVLSALIALVVCFGWIKRRRE